MSKVEKGKVTLTNTKEYTEDKKGNVKRQQNKGDVVFEAETVVGGLVIQKGAKVETPQGEGATASIGESGREVQEAFGCGRG